MYFGFQALRVAAQWLPFRVAQHLGYLFGVLAYGLLGAQRRLAQEHVAFAFGATVTATQRHQIVRQVFITFGQNFMEWLALPHLPPSRLERLITSEGVEHLRSALSQGRGALMVTAHLGNWELIPLYLKHLGFEGGVVARRLRYPEYESFLTHLRNRRGVATLARESFKEVAAMLRANRIVGLLPDQDIESLEGIFVEFFGHPAYTPVGPAALSVLTGAPIVPCIMRRLDDGRFHLMIDPPLAIPRGERPHAIAELTQAWSRVLETAIRRDPGQWAWMHRRWKTKPSTMAHSTEHTALSTPHTVPSPQPDLSAAVCCLLCAVCCVLSAGISGCQQATPRSSRPTPTSPAALSEAQDAAAGVTQRMSTFTLTGYATDGTKRWTLDGQGASVDGSIVTIHQPDAVGYDAARTAYLTATLAQMNQTNRYVRLEHDVTIHTSEGLWLTAPLLHWMPDRNQFATDTPVRIETDHMVLRGRGASGFTQLKHAQLLSDIELVLNPTDHEPSGQAVKQVTITCDGPLSLDYANNVATFERNVHVQDPSGDLYSDTLVAYLETATHTIKYAEASGHVRIHQSQNTALSERAIYEPALSKITLVGRPSLLLYPSHGASGPLVLQGLPTATPAEQSTASSSHVEAAGS